MSFAKKGKVANSRIVKLNISKPSVNKPKVEGQTSRKSIQKLDGVHSAIEHNAPIDPGTQFDKEEEAFVMRQLSAIFCHGQIALILSILKTKPDEVSIQGMVYDSVSRDCF